MCILIKDLSKRYNKNSVKSLDCINLEIPKGIFGLLGENGAGKTTLIKILTTTLHYDSGNIKMYEYDLKEDLESARKIIGYVPQNFNFFSNISVYELMDTIGLLKNILDDDKRKRDIYELLDKFNLSDKINVKIKKLSGGMKQRLGIAQSLLGNPQIIILDEPTVGLDPRERLRFRNIINEIARDKTVIISSHIISDIAMMCENIAIMEKGKIIYSGKIEKLIERTNGRVFTAKINNSEFINEVDYGKIISVIRNADSTEIRYLSNKENIIPNCIEVTPSLEDAYFYTTELEEIDEQ